MVKCKEYRYRDLTGLHEAFITDVQEEPNNFPDDGKSPNYCDTNLTIDFALVDPATGETSATHVEKFVAPLTGGKGLFQQLLDVTGELLDKGDGDFDIRKFIGVEVMVQIGLNKKGYHRVEGVTAVEKTTSVKAPVKVAPKAKQTKVTDEEEMPFA